MYTHINTYIHIHIHIHTHITHTHTQIHLTVYTNTDITKTTLPFFNEAVDYKSIHKMNWLRQTSRLIYEEARTDTAAITTAACYSSKIEMLEDITVISKLKSLEYISIRCKVYNSCHLVHIATIHRRFHSYYYRYYICYY